MITVSLKHRIFLAIAPVDFRKGIDALSRLCLSRFGQALFDEGHYFIFRNRRKTDLKIIYHDNQGCCLYQKRLDKGRFENWPTADNPVVTLTSVQLQILLQNGNPKDSLV